MARAKVDLKKLQQKIKDLEAKTALQANRTIRQEFKNKFLDLISKGISPIEGNGRFPAYKNTKKYPKSVRNKFPAKRNRPINLKLSGKFLNSFQVIVKKINVLEYGFFSKYGKDLESGHREGVHGQPPRPVIPDNSESLVKSLETLILKTYKDAVDAYLRKR